LRRVLRTTQGSAGHHSPHRRQRISRVCAQLEPPRREQRVFAVVDLAAAVGIDLRKIFKPSAEFLDLWTDERLVELAGRQGFPKDLADLQQRSELSRKELIDALLHEWPRGYVPIELVTVDEAGKFKSAKPSKKGK
jgi:hypothetical protein